MTFHCKLESQDWHVPAGDRTRRALRKDPFEHLVNSYSEHLGTYERATSGECSRHVLYSTHNFTQLCQESPRNQISLKVKSGFFSHYFIITATSAALQIPLCRRILKSYPAGQLRLRHWQSGALTTRLDLIHWKLQRFFRCRGAAKWNSMVFWIDYFRYLGTNACPQLIKKIRLIFSYRPKCFRTLFIILQVYSPDLFILLAIFIQLREEEKK